MCMYLRLTELKFKKEIIGASWSDKKDKAHAVPPSQGMGEKGWVSSYLLTKTGTRPGLRIQREIT